MKRALLFINGNLSDFSQVRKNIVKSDYIVGVDGGTNTIFRLGLFPHIVIGDLDSISKTTMKIISEHSVELRRYPKKKDKTDFELAIEFVIKKKYKEILIFGLLGERLDHLLANIFFLKKIFKQNKSLNIKIIEGNQEVFFVDKEIVLKGKTGDIASIIPFDTSIKNIELQGLEYQFKNKLLYFGSTQGVSNVMIKKTAKVSFRNGIGLVIHQKSNRKLRGI